MSDRSTMRRRTRLRFFGALLLAKLACLGSGCIHLIHPSAVRPGGFVEVVAGAALERYEPPRTPAGPNPDTSGGDFDLQLNAGHGWRFSENRALLLEFAFPLTGHRTTPLGALIGTTADLYYQFSSGALDAGVGGFVGLTSGLYAQAGRVLGGAPGSEWRADGGAALLATPTGLDDGDAWGVRPFGVLRWSGVRWSAGLWVDSARYSDPVKRCDESCETSDYLEERLGFGLFLGRSLR